MKLYKKLSAISFLKNSYILKFFFVSFLGIHIPLIGLLLTVVLSKTKYDQLSILLYTLGFTLVATIVTLFFIKKLMKPIELASKSLEDYRVNRTVPNLPLLYNDEAGKLLLHIQNTIIENEEYLNQKQDLIYLLTHDIKNYAGQPNTIADLILNEDCSETIREYANLIKTSAISQLEFLDACIDLLKINDRIDKAEIKPRIVLLPEIILNIQKQLKSNLTEKGVVVETEFNIEKVKLLIDDVLLFRVVFNLVHNALKFSHPNSKIFLQSQIVGKNLEIKVMDKGLGFDNSLNEKLFSKFSQMSRLGTSNEKSQGIGLYLCRQIIHKFKGNLEAYSEGENKGATFTITLPILD